MREKVLVTTADVDRCFEGRDHQLEVFVSLYKLIYPDWDRVESVDGYPKMSADLSKHIWGRFIEFDKVHHPDVIPGGLWFYSGFSTENRLPAETVIPAEVTMKDR